MSQQSETLSFEVILQQYRGLMYKIARAYCPYPQEQQDLVQEMAIQLWQSLPRYRPEFSMSTWLYRIFLNVAISQYRKINRRQQYFSALTEAQAAVPAQETAEQDRELQQLDQFIAELREVDKALMVLYLEDCPQAQIAEILGMSVSNVSTRVARIKQKLQKRFLQLKNA